MANPVPDPEYDDEKELWAFFGLAFYRMNLLEQGVINLAVALSARNIEGVTVKDVDRLYDDYDQNTFGKIFRAANSLMDLPEGIEADLQKALRYRNYLAHSFFLSHDADLITENGRKKMIDELAEIMEFLGSLDKAVDDLWMNAWEVLGITREWIEDNYKQFIDARRRGDA